LLGGSVCDGNAAVGANLRSVSLLFSTCRPVLRLLRDGFASLALLATLGDALATADGLHLAEAVYGRPIGQDVTTVSRMELIEKGRSPRVRELIAYRTRRAGGETAHLIRFTEPTDVAGTGLLSLDRADGSNEQWLYLPALDRVRRIASDRKGGRFVGSELYYEDLQDRRPERDRHRLLGNDAVDGVPCELLESVPIDRADSVYRKRVSCVDRSTLLALRVDYYEQDDVTPSKRWLLVAKKKHRSYWTVTDSRMIDLASGRVTRMVVEEALYDRKLPAKLFTSQALADENLEAEYRP
jgi:hypothetical protein